jgi:hypothetical protein
MYFESLANELILDIFEYFNSIQLLYTFHGLNNRINELLQLYFQTFPLDFRSVSKQDFDIICQKTLPLITDHITSIHLSNDDDTPDEPNLFFSYGFHFQQFPKLQSISLYHIHSMDLINRIILDCSNLIYLNLNKCHFDEICMNNIWNLPKLKSFYLDNDIVTPSPTRTSSSLQDLSIQNDLFSLNYLISLFKYTPNLQNLNIRITDTSDGEQIPFIIPLLTKLKLYFKGTLSTLRNLLENLPNLFELIIEIDDIYIDGYQWEEIIRQYLPKLKVFKFLMYYKFDLDEEINQLMESFQTKSCLDESQWSVRCDYHTEYKTINLYSLPFGFKKFSNQANNMSISTDKKCDLFNHVNILILDEFLLKFAVEFPLVFSNIRHLELSYPFDENIWRIIPKLDRLKSLEIISTMHAGETDRSLNNLRLLLNQSIHLYSLTLDYLFMSELASLEISNTSIHRLDLMTNDGHFYGLECISLIQSFIGNRCEVLLINLENRFIVIDLIKNLFHLRALTFQCQDDQWGDSNESLLIDDELIQWFKSHLPSNCSIIRDQCEISAIRIWIR